MAWIQGKNGLWWRDPQWWDDDVMVDTDPIDGEIRARCKGKSRKVKACLKKHGFTDPEIKRGEDDLVGWNNYLIWPSAPVPTPSRHDGEYEGWISGETFSEERVIRFAIRIDEQRARELWSKHPPKLIVDWFGSLGLAKRSMRKVFKLLDSNPHLYPAMTKGMVLVNRKGVRV